MFIPFLIQGNLSSKYVLIEFFERSHFVLNFIEIYITSSRYLYSLRNINGREDYAHPIYPQLPFSKHCLIVHKDILCKRGTTGPSETRTRINVIEFRSQFQRNEKKKTQELKRY